MGEKEDLIKEAETLIEESFSKVPANTDELEDIVMILGAIGMRV